MGIRFDEQSCSPCVKPNKISNLSRAIFETLMHYTRMINFRVEMDICGRGVLLYFQCMKMGYFDPRVELNPVKEKIVDKAWD